MLTLTGERTIPDLDIENYWLAHQVVYRLSRRTARDAGSWLREGYGADLTPAPLRSSR